MKDVHKKRKEGNDKEKEKGREKKEALSRHILIRIHK